jgi:outer membrane protein assembly factor BamB
VALDKKSGEERWRALDDVAQYSAPVLVEQAGKPVVVCWTGASVAGIDPDTGAVQWRQPMPVSRMPIGVATPVFNQDRIFVSSFYDGSLLLKLRSDVPRADVLWRRMGRDERNTDALHCMISTPVMEGDFIYGVDSYGELRCLDARTGDRIWEDLSATPRNRWSNIHIVRNGDRYWLFNERGQLIIGRLSPQGFREISRTQLLDPTSEQLRQRGGVCWSHPAFADRHIFARNDRELVCASLEAP